MLKKVHSAIKFNQKSSSKPYVDVTAYLRKKAKNDFGRNYPKLTNNAVFGKTLENVRKYRGIKLVATEERSNYLVSEPKYQSQLANCFSKHFSAIKLIKPKYT